MKSVSNNQYQEDLLQLSSSLSKMLKRRFGKGPETCFVTLHSDRLVAYTRNFMTPAEEVLIKNKKKKLATNFRSAVVETIFDEFSQEASNVLNLAFNSFFNDWDYETNTGIMLLECETSNQWKDTDIAPSFKEMLCQRIIQVSSKAHIIPKQLEIIRINQNMFVLSCHGTLLKIEYVLLKKGYFDILQERSSEIKKTYKNEKELFESIFNRNIEDLFITWDYKKDRSYIFFCLS